MQKVLKKIAVFGSCMSNLTAARMIQLFGFEQHFCIHHNRSDTFLAYYIDRNKELIPKSYFDSLSLKSGFGINEQSILENQYPEQLGYFQLNHLKKDRITFFEDFRDTQIDLILLDNFLDISSMLMEEISNPDLAGRPLFINLDFYEQSEELKKKFKFTPFLSPLQSALNWLRIYEWIRKMQPHAKIVFLPYHTCSSLSNYDRYERISGFYSLFSRLIADKDLILFPPLEMPEEKTKGELDWAHFQDDIYFALAGAVYLKFLDLKPRVALPKVVGNKSAS
jgi:hypothetical protein